MTPGTYPIVLLVQDRDGDWGYKVKAAHITVEDI